MSVIRRLCRSTVTWLFCLAVLAGCSEALHNAIDDSGMLPPTLLPTLNPTDSVQKETHWQQAAPGLEWRRLQATGDSGASDRLLIVRVDPSRLRIRVAYDVAAPGTIGEWQQALRPLLVVNGGYYDGQGRATALVINDGAIHGSSYEGFGGMFTVSSDGSVNIRSLRDQPYHPAEDIVQALQSTPMLLLPDGSIPAIEDDGDLARRTVIAIDRQGRLVFIVSSRPVFTLSGLARWLRDSDLDLQTALNLDGGSSTGIYLETGDAPLLIDSLARVPLVILVEERQH